jgi:signal transduction histidine kinase
MTLGKRLLGTPGLAADGSSRVAQMDAQPRHPTPADALDPRREASTLRAALCQQTLWLACMAHDLRTPLTVIDLRTQSLHRALTGLLASATPASATGAASEASAASGAPLPIATGAIRGSLEHYELRGQLRRGRQERPMSSHPAPEPIRREQTAPDRAREQVQARLARITAAVSSMVRLLDELADLAGARAGYRPVLQRRPTDLVALAREVAGGYDFVPQDLSDPAELPRTTQARGQVPARARIQVTAHRPRVTGYWDAQRVLGNLLDNAIKYSLQGGKIVVEVRANSPVARAPGP